jgi:hypothetical protein
MAAVPGPTNSVAYLPLGDIIAQGRHTPDDLVAGNDGAS